MRRFDEIDSTNTWLLGQARRGAPEGLVAVADHQTAGRGRRGRSWEAPPGANLLTSILLRPVALPIERRHLVVACVALAARDACAEVAGPAIGQSIGLKWPNDLLLGGAKLAGVLAEADGDAVVVGVGLNVGWAPPEATSLRAALDDAPEVVAPGPVLGALLAALERRYEAGEWSAVATAYRRACVTIGAEVRVELVDETFTGVAADVTDDGHLLVETGACLRTVTAGDVVHLR